MKTWSQAETETLKQHYGKVTNSMLAEMLPQKTQLAIYKKARALGLSSTEEIKFLNRSEANKGDKASNWRGGKGKTRKGYNTVLRPGHHRADSRGYVLEHILVFEEATGVAVPQGCCVHHLNGIRDDNRVENLCMMTHGAHTAMHNRGRQHSEETRKAISGKAKQRLADKQNHPSYKSVDMVFIQSLIDNGCTVREACKRVGIDRTTYYRKMRYENNA